MHLSCGRGHGARENDNTLRNVFLLQDVEQPERKLRIGICEWHVKVYGENTNFRMVFTPTLFSSEKNMNIWLEGSVRELVKKLSWLRLQDKAAQSVTRFEDSQRSCALDSTPVICILCLEIGERHIDFLICYLVALRVGAFSQMSKRELGKALLHPIFDKFMYCAINFP